MMDKSGRDQCKQVINLLPKFNIVHHRRDCKGTWHQFHKSYLKKCIWTLHKPKLKNNWPSFSSPSKEARQRKAEEPPALKQMLEMSQLGTTGAPPSCHVVFKEETPGPSNRDQIYTGFRPQNPKRMESLNGQ